MNEAFGKDVIDSYIKLRTSEINDFNQQLGKDHTSNDSKYLTEALTNVRRVAKHGSAIFLISDFANFDEDARLHFGQLARHNDIVGIHISDHLERELPRPDYYTITDGQSRARINTASKKHRTAYHQAYDNNLDIVKATFSKQKYNDHKTKTCFFRSYTVQYIFPSE